MWFFGYLSSFQSVYIISNFVRLYKISKSEAGKIKVDEKRGDKEKD